MKKKIISIAIILVAIFVLTFYFSQKQSAAVQNKAKAPITVSVQAAADSKKLIQSIQYPAVTAGDQEITLLANVSGSIASLNFDLGEKVAQGKQLVVIDEIGNNSGIGENGLKSSQIQVLELAVKSAEEKYKSAKRTYEDDDTYANKKSKEVAEIDLETAKANLKGALNNRFVISPIAGTITQKLVSAGDSVVVGQKIATISKTALTKVQFYVNKEDLENFKIGFLITIKDGEKEVAGSVVKIAPVADLTTRRFLVEARPNDQKPFLIGSIIYVSCEITRNPLAVENFILPLSAITVGQNESHIFIVDNKKAKQVSVEVKNVQGEFAEVKAEIPSGALIITEGNKLVQDNDSVEITNQ